MTVTKSWGRHPYHPRRFDHGQPIWKPNFSLTVGIWICLAAMTLWTVRPQTHAVVIDLPFLGTPPYDHIVDPIRIKVGIDAGGAIRWDGTEISIAQLAEYLNQTREQPVEPLIVLQPQPLASYERSLHVLAVIANSGVLFCMGGLLENAHALDSSGASSFGLLAISADGVGLYQSECEPVDQPPPG